MYEPISIDELVETVSLAYERTLSLLLDGNLAATHLTDIETILSTVFVLLSAFWFINFLMGRYL